MKKTFVTLFPEAENVHLIKDVGSIPFVMQSHWGYDATLVCYNNSEHYSYLDSEVKGLKIEFLEHKYKHDSINGCWFLKQKAREIDVLHLFHFKVRTFLWILAYKHYNKQGHIYLKSDARFDIFSNRNEKSVLGKIRHKVESKILKKCTVISAESKSTCEFVSNYYGVDVVLIPNGILEEEPVLADTAKENMILTVGKLGTYEKNTELLLNAFLKSSSEHDWNLYLVGSVEPKFGRYREQLFEQFPLMRDRVFFVGVITDREEIRRMYQRAKVFVLSSRIEGSPLASMEAMEQGCYLITTTGVPSTVDLANGMKYGCVVENENEEALAQAFTSICKDKYLTDELHREIQKYLYEHYLWKDVCGVLAEHLKEA